MQRNPVGKLLLFGATGDLAQRMLWPSLYGLHADGLLPEALTIVGSARGDQNDDAFRAFVQKALGQFLAADRKDDDKIASFLERLFFQPADLSDPASFAGLAEKIGDVSGGLAIYLSTAPSLFEPAVKGLESVGLAGWKCRMPASTKAPRLTPIEFMLRTIWLGDSSNAKYSTCSPRRQAAATK